MLITTVKIIFIHILLLLGTLIPQKTLMFGYVGNIKTILPSEAQTDSEKSMSKLVFRQLYKYEDGKLVEDLINDIKTSDDNKTHIIKIKEKQYWQDRTEITSNDVIYSLAKYDSFLKNMTIEKTGKYEIKLTLTTPIQILPSLLTIGIEPSHIKNNAKLEPIGSTSFYISKVSREQNRVNSITLQSFQKNKKYNRIKFKFYKKEDDLESAYKLGEIDSFISNRSYNFSDKLNITPLTFLGRQYTIIFNTNSDHVKDPEVRKKLAQSLNITKLIQENHFFENNLISEGPISHSEYTKEVFKTPLYEEKVNLSATEKEELKGLLVLLPNNDEGEQIKNFIQESWGKQNDIEIIFEFLDLKDLIQRAYEGTFDAVFIGIETTPDPDRYTYWHSTQIKSGFNLSHFQDPRADKALVEGRQTKNTEERTSHYNIFQDVIYTKTPAIFLYHPGELLYTSDNVDIPMPKVLYYPWELFQNL